MPDPEGYSQLVTRVARGDPAAVAEIYLSLRDPVRWQCHRLLRSDSYAEDAAADVLLRIEKLAQSYDGSISFQGWVLKATTNHCIDVLRKRQREQRWVVDDLGAVESVRAAVASPLDRLIDEQQRDRVRSVLRELPDLQRVVLVLRYFEDLSYAEIAERLQIPKVTVGTSLFRAKALLRERFGSSRHEWESDT